MVFPNLSTFDGPYHARLCSLCHLASHRRVKDLWFPLSQRRIHCYLLVSSSLTFILDVDIVAQIMERVLRLLGIGSCRCMFAFETTLPPSV